MPQLGPEAAIYIKSTVRSIALQQIFIHSRNIDVETIINNK